MSKVAVSKMDFVRELFRDLSVEEMTNFPPDRIVALYRERYRGDMPLGTASNYKTVVRREYEKASRTRVGASNGTAVADTRTHNYQGVVFDQRLFSALDNLRSMIDTFGVSNVRGLVEYLASKEKE